MVPVVAWGPVVGHGHFRALGFPKALSSSPRPHSGFSDSGGSQVKDGFTCLRWAEPVASLNPPAAS